MVINRHCFLQDKIHFEQLYGNYLFRMHSGLYKYKYKYIYKYNMYTSAGSGHLTNKRNGPISGCVKRQKLRTW